MKTQNQETLDTLHSLVYDVVLEAAKLGMTAAFPFLGWPVVKQVFSLMVNKFADFFYGALEKLMAFSAIDNQVTAQQKAFAEATAVLRLELTKPLPEKSEAEIAKAKAEFKDKLKDLIRVRPA